MVGRALPLLALALAGCAGNGTPPVGSGDASVRRDAGASDAGTTARDAGPPARDGGPSNPDSGPPDTPDAGPGTPDTGTGPRDAGPPPGCASAADCDDGDPCTADSCSGEFACVHTPMCDCTTDAECIGRVSPGPCQRAACTDNRCVTVADPSQDGATCDADSNGCTTGDRCAAGSCVAGATERCDDGMGCTIDNCISTGPSTFRCESVTGTASCMIGGTCYPRGARNGVCEHCDPDVSRTSWSPDVGASCSDGDSCTTTDRCGSDGTCTGSPIVDGYEPNDTRAAARNLGSILDTSSFPAGTFTASLYPSGDEDWYRFHDDDRVGGAVHPRVELRNVPSGSDYDLCVYYDCDTTGSASGCGAGNSSTFEGLSGCCSAGAGSSDETVELNVSCSGPDESGVAYVRVFRFAGAPTCADYTLRWGDD